MKNSASMFKKIGPISWRIVLGILIISPNNSAIAQDLMLKSNPTASGSHILVGDIFENAGPQANRVLARAPDARQKTTFATDILSTRLATFGLSWRAPSDLKQITIYGAQKGGTPIATTGANLAPPSSIISANQSFEVPVLKRDVLRDEEITYDMIEYQKTEQTNPNIIKDAANLIGTRAKINLHANIPIKASEIAQSILVKRGQNIILVHQIGGLKLTLQGRALDNGVAGSKIRVVNTQSNKTIDAIVENDGTARSISPIMTNLASR